MVNIEFKYANITSAEAEQTSFSRIVQRDLIRRGFFPPRSGPGWDARDCAVLLVMGCLSARGLPPAVSSEIAYPKSMSVQVLLHALDVPGAVAAEDGTEWKGEKPIKEPPGMRKRFAIVYGPAEASSTTFQDDLGEFYETSQIDLSAAIVLDLKRLGAKLAGMIDRPLVTVVVA